jgi:hypothetical protein
VSFFVRSLGWVFGIYIDQKEKSNQSNSRENVACWPNGKALDYESRDCRFDPCVGHSDFLDFLVVFWGEGELSLCRRRFICGEADRGVCYIAAFAVTTFLYKS